MTSNGSESTYYTSCYPSKIVVPSIISENVYISEQQQKKNFLYRAATRKYIPLNYTFDVYNTCLY